MTKTPCSHIAQELKENCNYPYAMLFELPGNCGLPEGTAEAGSHLIFQGRSTGPGSDWLGPCDVFHTNAAATSALHTLVASCINTDTGQ